MAIVLRRVGELAARRPATRRLLLAALALAAVPWAHRAEAQRRETVDRIVAVVGQRPILLSEIQEALLLRQSSGQALPADSAGRAEVFAQALSELVDEEVLYQRARRDTTITVQEAEVQNAVEEDVRRIRASFTSELDYRTQLRAAGFGTPEEYRRWLSEQRRRNLFVEKFIQKLRQDGKLRPVTVTDADVREAFERSRARLGRRPPTVSFRQIVVAPRPSAAARSAARVRAESALAEIRRGADFETAARRLSEDPTTRERGGDLGWFRRGAMVPEFERVAFRLRPGQVSEVVTTPFGYHLIQVDRVQPAEVKARHVLFVPAVTEAELVAAQFVADSVAEALRAGTGFDALHARHADTTEAKAVGPLTQAQLPPAYAAALESAGVGEVVGPVPLQAELASRTRYAVLVVDDVQTERDFTLEEVRDQIRQSLSQERAMRDLVATLRRQTYVDVRP